MIKDIEKYIEFIQFVVDITNNFKFEKQTPEQIVSVAFYNKMVDSAQNVLTL